MANFTGLCDAIGLADQEKLVLGDLVRVFNRNEIKNNERKLYYEDKIAVKPLGYTIPEARIQNINTRTGWAAKAVDMLAARSRFEGFVFEEYVPDDFENIMRQNRIKESYSMAVSSELVHGCGFWTIDGGDVEDGEPAVVVNYHNAQSAAAIWDFRRRRIKAGFAICDFDKFSKNGSYVPSRVGLYTNKHVIVIVRVDYNQWVATYYRHYLGRPPMEPMVYRYREDKPFGRSRISRAVMGYVDDAQREILNTVVQSEIYSMPQKWMTNLTDDQFDAVMSEKMKMYTTNVLAITEGANGDPVNLGMFQGASMEPHIAVLDKLANLMAAETCLPVATFGVAGNGYTSSDALRASSDDLVLEADALNDRNGEALKNVALMAMAIMRGTSVEGLGDNEKSVDVLWHDTEMLTAAQSTDSAIKIASVVPAYPNTDIFWERLGFDQSDIRRLSAQISGESAKNALMSTLFGGNNGNNGGEAS